jgi:hypothetical protein
MRRFIIIMYMTIEFDSNLILSILLIVVYFDVISNFHFEYSADPPVLPCTTVERNNIYFDDNNMCKRYGLL